MTNSTASRFPKKVVDQKIVTGGGGSNVDVKSVDGGGIHDVVFSKSSDKK